MTLGPYEILSKLGTGAFVHRKIVPQLHMADARQLFPAPGQRAARRFPPKSLRLIAFTATLSARAESIPLAQ